MWMEIVKIRQNLEKNATQNMIPPIICEKNNKKYELTTKKAEPIRIAFTRTSKSFGTETEYLSYYSIKIMYEFKL